MTLHRLRRSTLSNDKIQETYETLKKKSSCSDSLPKNSKSFDEDGYLSPMEIKAKVSRNFFYKIKKISHKINVFF